MRNCLVPFCSNKGSIDGVCYFRLTKTRLPTWKRALNRSENEVLSTDSCICSDHFELKDFISPNDKKKGLKPDVIPTLKLRPSSFRRQIIKREIEEVWLPSAPLVEDTAQREDLPVSKSVSPISGLHIRQNSETDNVQNLSALVGERKMLKRHLSMIILLPAKTRHYNI